VLAKGLFLFAVNVLFDKKTLDAIQALITPAARVVILPHHKPDGDAMGASLAMYNYLAGHAGPTTVISPGEYPGFLGWMKGCDQVLSTHHQAERCIRRLEEADIVFCLDFNDPGRVEQLTPALVASKAKKVLIDHHLAPVPFCDFTLSVPEASSTCELVYAFIVQSGHRDRIDKDIAECLYAGIMTDTGSFRFSSMHAGAHRIVADLIDAGAVNYRIHERVFDNFSEERTRFVGYCIKEKLVVLREFNTAYISVTRDELQHYSHRAGDTEGIVNYGLGIRGIRMAAFFSEREDLVKISFRSKGEFSVKDVAARYFEGGGHKNAAGGRSRLNLADTIDRFISILPEYRDALTA